jgi:hypothetical protein
MFACACQFWKGIFLNNNNNNNNSDNDNINNVVLKIHIIIRLCSPESCLHFSVLVRDFIFNNYNGKVYNYYAYNEHLALKIHTVVGLRRPNA